MPLCIFPVPLTTRCCGRGGGIVVVEAVVVVVVVVVLVVDLLAGSVVKLLGSLEGSLEGALEATAASSAFLVVGSSVVVVVVEAVGLAVATLLAFDCEDALPTATITNKINFITLYSSCTSREDSASSLLLAGQLFLSVSRG